MTRVSASPDGLASNIMIEHYRKFAKGGWGLIFTEGTYTDEGPSQGYRNQPGIANSKHIAEWSKVVKMDLLWKEACNHTSMKDPSPLRSAARGTQAEPPRRDREYPRFHGPRTTPPGLRARLRLFQS
jgi:hypothetical protein